jgi:predicted ATPase/DNA-binding XRE family transcriptional regulator
VAVVTPPFGTLLRAYRIAAGVSQETLAERARLSVETISALERGARRSPYGDTVARLAAALALSDDERCALEGASIHPRAKARTAVHHNIPLQTTRLVGRDEAVAAVTGLLADARLVTLTGAPGVGKTRLALAVAAGAAPSLPDGAWLVELAPIGNAAAVASAVGSAFGLRDQGTKRGALALAHYLRNKHLLLVLDNCEHVLAGCAELVSLLLQSCPGVRVLATSREPLRIHGEQCSRVASLSVPADDSADGLAFSDSATLFVERAGNVDAAFTVRAGDAGAIATICRRLDGIPLALELAAARTRTIPMTRIASALDDRFRLLTHGERVALPRHQTLEALFGWSYELLSTEERMLFRRLGIFTGPWTFELAKDTCAGNAVAADAVLDLLQSLVDKSLVVADFERPAPYRLLESSRAYARERLAEAGELESLTRRHAEVLRDTALRAHEEWHAGENDAPLRPLVAVIDNARAALDWAISTRGDRRVGATLIAELLQVWVLIGAVSEGLHWVDRALEPPDGHEAALDEVTVARLHLAAGLLTMLLMRPGRSIESGQRALEYFRTVGDDNRSVEALDFLSRALRYAGRLEEAMRAIEEGGAIARARRLPRYSAQFVCWAAAVEIEMGRFDDARRHLTEAETLFRGLRYPRGLRFVHANVAHAAYAAGEYERVIGVESLEFDERQAVGVEGLWALPQILYLRAAAHIALGVLDAAQTDALEAIERARRMSETGFVCPAVEQLALVAAMRGDLCRAARLLGYSETARAIDWRRIRAERLSYERLVALLEGLDGDERARLMAEGARFDEDALVAEALSVERG